MHLSDEPLELSPEVAMTLGAMAQADALRSCAVTHADRCCVVLLDEVLRLREALELVAVQARWADSSYGYVLKERLWKCGTIATDALIRTPTP